MSTVTVDWGDGNSEDVPVDPVDGSWSFDDVTHTYAEPGDYEIVVSDGEAQGTAPVEVIGPFAITTLEPDTAAIDGEDFEGHVRGTGFTEDTVIVWNDGDEPTRFVDSTDVWTIVKPSVVTSPTVLDVTVRDGDVTLDPPLEFTWTEAVSAAPAGPAEGGDADHIPTASDMQPRSGTNETPVSITGEDLDTITAVQFGGQDGEIVEQDANEIVVYPPDLTGWQSVALIHPNGQIGAPFAFEYTA